MAIRAQSLFSVDRVLSGQRDDVVQGAAVVFPPQIRVSLLVLATALAYYFGSEVGYRFTPANTPIGTLWPPNAILLAALLMAPTRLWPFLFMGVLPAHLLAQLLSKGVPWDAAIGWFLGNGAEALLGAVCIRYFQRQRVFESLRGIVTFVCFGVLLAPFVTSFLDAGVVVLTHQANGYWLPWTSRLSSNMISDLIFVPMIVLIGQRGLSWLRTPSLKRWLEAIVLVSGTAISSLLIFGRQNLASRVPPLICVPLLFLLWAALRFDLAVLSTSLLVISVISIWNAMMGHGPLAQLSMTQNVIFLHFFLLGLTLPLVLMMGYMLDQRRTLSSWVTTRAQLLSWEDRERERIGRVLHNDIVQQLALIAVEVDRMRFIGHLPGGTDLDTLYRDVTQVCDTTRVLSHDVHPFVLEYAGLGPALRNLSRRAAEQSGIDITFTEHEVREVELEVARCIYHVAQEAVRNVVKHSGARTAKVDLRISAASAMLRVVDDGVGISSQQCVSRGTGLASMRERVTALKGSLEIVSAGTKGTSVIATLSLPVQLHVRRA